MSASTFYSKFRPNAAHNQPCKIKKAHFTIHHVTMMPAVCCHACTTGIMYHT